MKEWALKHPILTFLLINDAVVCITNIFVEKKRDTIAARVTDAVGEGLGEVVGIIDKTKETTKQPIGFAV